MAHQKIISQPFDGVFPDMLYIHWPFCASKCHYCDFVAMQEHEEFVQSYHDALCAEIADFVSAGAARHAKIKTIFLGGGTPSMYPLHLLQELFELLDRSFDLSDVQEVSLEVNPGPADTQGPSTTHLSTWKDLGINRLSIGVQVLDDAVLEKMNRPQCVADVEQLFQIAPAYIPNLSADFIIGLPGVTDNVWRDTITTALKWRITHSSVYFLTVHENTPLYHGVKAGKIRLPRDENMLQQYSWTIDQLEKAGFAQYETSNFAQSGYQSLHNQGYWERKKYKGFGLGAASFDGTHRTCNQKNLSRYIQYWKGANREANKQYAYCEKLTGEQAVIELLMLGIRQSKGVDLHDVVYYCNAQERASFFMIHSRLVEQGLLEPSKAVARLTRKGRLFENEVVVQLSHGLEKAVAVKSEER